VQPTFLNDINDIIEKGKIIPSNFGNSYGEFDNTKICICMAGQITDRKNYKLFVTTAEIFPEYNFLWIGGSENQTHIFSNKKNIYHIPYTENPYAYYNNIVDYFILFSTFDPCPFVVLENIIFSTPIITFKENIFTDHTSILISDIYHECDGKVELKNTIDAINTYVKNKKNINNTNHNNHIKYVVDNFSSPVQINNIISKI
jgi:hypothetical protein